MKIPNEGWLFDDLCEVPEIRKDWLKDEKDEELSESYKIDIQMSNDILDIIAKAGDNEMISLNIDQVSWLEMHLNIERDMIQDSMKEFTDNELLKSDLEMINRLSDRTYSPVWLGGVFRV